MSSSPPHSCSRCGATCERPAKFCPVCGYTLSTVSVFFSYSHRDKMLRDRLEDHLSNLKYRGLITTWHDREIRAGEEWMQQIDIYLNTAHIILLLISADFMASQYCYGIEMRQALKRHEQGEANVIPILLRPVLFKDAPFAKLQMLPSNGKPVIGWRDRDSAFFDIACGIEKVAQKYSDSLVFPKLDFIPSGPMRERLSNFPPQAQLSKRSSSLSSMIGVVMIAGLIVAGILALIQHPSLIPFFIYFFISIIGLLLLFAGIAAVRKVFRAIRARNEQRRAQEAREAARKRRYYEEAIEAYQHALSRNPSDVDAFRGMGNAYYALKRFNEALNAYQRAIKCTPTSAIAYAGLGNVYVELKQYTEAIAAYEKAIELDPSVTLNYDGFIQSLLAEGRKREAEEAYTRAKQLGYDESY